jgi:hypothetical protein
MMDTRRRCIFADLSPAFGSVKISPPPRGNSLEHKHLANYFSRWRAGLAVLLVIAGGLFSACDLMGGFDWVEENTGSQLTVYFDSDIPGGGFERWNCTVGETIVLPDGAKLFQVDRTFVTWKLVGGVEETGVYAANSSYHVKGNVVFTSVWGD